MILDYRCPDSTISPRHHAINEVGIGPMCYFCLEPLILAPQIHTATWAVERQYVIREELW